MSIASWQRLGVPGRDLTFTAALLVASLACAPTGMRPVRPKAPAPMEDRRIATSPVQVRLPPAPPGVSPAPAECGFYPAAVSTGVCPANPRQQLVVALSSTDQKERDDILYSLEACEGPAGAFESGIVRALRAELVPLGCAERLVADYLATLDAGTVRPDVLDTLYALGLASRLERSVTAVPTTEGQIDKAGFAEYFEQKLKPWVLAQAQAVHASALEGSKLFGYAKGIVAIAAGLADMRFVKAARSAPIPEEISQDAELSEVYYSSLDQALEPRKQRGRDAALVGLAEFAELGVLKDPRVERARLLISELFAGKRIDALDRLLLPAVPVLSPISHDEKLASLLPSFYAQELLTSVDPTHPGILRALLEQGLPPVLRARLRTADVGPSATELYVQGLVRMGTLYFSASDFAEAVRLSDESSKSQSLELLHALASALETGPADLRELIEKGQASLQRVKTPELDELAAKNGTFAGHALFNAAYLRELAPPQDDPAFWQTLATRYLRAAELLEAGGETEFAERARARMAGATETAREIEKHGSPPIE